MIAGVGGVQRLQRLHGGALRRIAAAERAVEQEAVVLGTGARAGGGR
jgi:hypothetical protein